MISFLAPVAGFVAAAIAIPSLVLLYFLKLRRRKLDVSSTMLWRRAVQDLQVNAPFQKLRRNLLLLLQLLVLAALLFAFARPTLKGASTSGQRLVVVVDRSASMNATDVDPSRLERAKTLALRLIEDFDGAGGAMVVSFAHQARVAQPFTTDRTLLRRAVRSVEPTDQLSRLEPALRLVEPFAVGGAGSGGDGQAVAGEPLLVYVLSDGRIHGGSELSMHGGDIRFVSLGRKAADGDPDNLAIVALSARRDFSEPQNVQVFARLANYGPRSVEANLSLTVEGVLQRVVAVRVPARRPGEPADAGGSASTEPDGPGAMVTGMPPGLPGSESVQFDLELDRSALIAVAHDHADHLDADDAAALVLAPPRRLRVMLVTAGNGFLERVIEAVGVEALETVAPEAFEAMGSQAARSRGVDVLVFDRVAPDEVPVIPAVYFGAVPPVEGLSLVPAGEDEPRTQYLLDWKRDHPVMRYVAMDDVLLDRPGRLALPLGANATILATGQNGPVVAEVVADRTPHVATSFSVLRSNWPMQVSFAVFVSNAIHHLGLGGFSQAGIAYRPGEVATVRAGSDGGEVGYDGPARLTARARRGRAVLPVFEQVGIYEAQSDAVPPWDRLAVNLTDTTESDLRPAERIRVGTVDVRAAGGGEAAIRREVWFWFAAAALAALMVEWGVYTRRMHL